MSDWPRNLIARHSSRGILIDTNVLLLLYVGSLDRNLVPKFKRTDRFAPEDYDALRKLIRPFKTVLTTHHILTEVCNLLGQLKEPARSTCLLLFRKRFVNL